MRTTIILGHARGVILLAGTARGARIHEYPPAEIKKAICGTGAATKEQVQFMVARLLRLKSAPSPADAADGVAAALTCLMTARRRAGGTAIASTAAFALRTPRRAAPHAHVPR